MGKTYSEIKNEPVMAAEPVAPPYTAPNPSHAMPKTVSTKEHIMASTVSVDEYFDELVSQVREDYASL